MRVSCLQENLAWGLAIVGRAVSPRSTLPVLSNILLATDEGRLKLSATNLEVAITCWIGAKVEDDGQITVPARLLAEFVNQLPPEQIDMELDVRNLILNLRCARYNTHIKGIDASEFPVIPSAEGKDAIQVKAPTLRKIVNQVVFAAASDDSRPTLTGVDVKIRGDRLHMAATDGFRLSLRSTVLEEPATESREVIIPARALSELSRIIGLLPDAEDQIVEIAIADHHNQVLFHLPNVDMVSQLIDANFPDYRAIIPTGYKTRTTVDSQSLLRALRLSSLFARDNSYIVRLHITGDQKEKPGSLTLSATSKESGDNVADLDAIVEGTNAEIAFNARYIIDLLSVIDEPQVALETTESSKPGVMRPVGVGPEEFTCVIMPMHLNK